MKFNGIEHHDYFDFDDTTIFWAEISDLPQHIQDEAKIIDGAEYNANCFGVCVHYDSSTKEFVVVTDTDLSTGESNNIYYVDNDGDKHWFKAEIAEEFTNQIFTACNKINAGKDKVHGYEIKRSIVFENDRGFALAENPNAPQPFVTWMFTDEENGKRDHYWGHYTKNGDAATRDYELRVAEYQKDYGLSERGAYKYYSTQRPVDIGTFPKTENGPIRLVNFEEREGVEMGHYQAWGYLVYDAPLTEKQIDDYELRAAHDNPDVKQRMREQAQTVGEWEEKRNIPGNLRLTEWMPDSEAFYAKLYVTPEQMKQRYDQAVEALARISGNRPRSIAAQLAEGAEQAARDNAARPVPMPDKDKGDRT